MWSSGFPGSPRDFAAFSHASKEDLEKWRIEIPEVFLRRLSKDLKRTPNAIREQLQHMGLIER